MPDQAALVHRTMPARGGQPPHPGLVLIHGRGADELDLLGLGPELDPSCFIVSVRAPYAWQIGYCWFERDPPATYAATFPRALDLLRSFVEQLPSAYPIDPQRLFLLGFSQGAYMANALLLTAPRLLHGAMLLSGFQPPPDSLPLERAGVRGKPVFVGHGRYDPLLGVEQGRLVRDTLSGLGVDLSYHEYDMAHQIIPPEIDDLRAWLSARIATG